MVRPHGNVTEVSVIMDKATGMSRGFAFVTLSSHAEALNAIRVRCGRQAPRARAARSTPGCGGASAAPVLST